MWDELAADEKDKYNQEYLRNKEEYQKATLRANKAAKGKKTAKKEEQESLVKKEQKEEKRAPARTTELLSRASERPTLASEKATRTSERLSRGKLGKKETKSPTTHSARRR